MREKIKSSGAGRCGGEPRRRAADRLLDVACDLFYRRGIRAVGVDEIVCETGVTKPTLYRSFDSKDDLVAGCLQSRIEAKWLRLEEIGKEFGHDPLAHLRAIMEFFAEEIQRPEYRGCEATNTAVEFPERDHPAREIAEKSKIRMRGLLSSICGKLPVSDPEALADGLFLMLEGAFACRHTSGSQGPSAALIRSSEALLRAYLDKGR